MMHAIFKEKCIHRSRSRKPIFKGLISIVFRTSAKAWPPGADRCRRPRPLVQRVNDYVTELRGLIRSEVHPNIFFLKHLEESTLPLCKKHCHNMTRLFTARLTFPFVSSAFSRFDHRLE
jgi:hypothetical protein